MQTIEQALREVCQLHEQLTQSPAPEIRPQVFLPFPPGIDPVAFAVEEVSQLKQLLGNRDATPSAPQVAWVPRADIYASETEVLVTVEIPGVAREAVSVTVAGEELVVSGQRAPASPAGNLRPVAVEQAWGNFERRFPVPPWCRPEKITARYAHGVLEIHFTRVDEETSGEFRVEVS